jgi:hypothetical protein
VAPSWRRDTQNTDNQYDDNQLNDADRNGLNCNTQRSVMLIVTFFHVMLCIMLSDVCHCAMGH